MSFEKLLDANIAILSKAEQSKRGKPLKAEFVRDDGAGGKFYGYRGRGTQQSRGYEKGPVRIKSSRGRFGSVSGDISGEMGEDVRIVHVKPHPGGVKPPKNAKLSAPDSHSDQALDMDGKKTAYWKRDADNILSGQGGALSASKGKKIDISGDISKEFTNIENTLARYAESEAQFMKVKLGAAPKKAYRLGIDRARKAFGSLVDSISGHTSKPVVYDQTQNAFLYADGKKLGPRDVAIANRIIDGLKTTLEKKIKARTTAVRRAEGSDE